MPATHSLTLHFPLPASLPPDVVLAQLHAHEPLITPHPYLVSYRRRPVPLEDVLGDPFFTEQGSQLAAYEVTERIVLVPGLSGDRHRSEGGVGKGRHRLADLCSKDVRIPAVFQSFETGVRCRADAQGGVRVWSTYEVARRGGGDGAAPAGAGAEQVVAAGPAGDAGAWELVETVRLECAGWLKGFVVKSLEAAHRDIGKRMIEQMVRARGLERWG